MSLKVVNIRDTEATGGAADEAGVDEAVNALANMGSRGGSLFDADADADASYEDDDYGQVDDDARYEGSFEEGGGDDDGFLGGGGGLWSAGGSTSRKSAPLSASSTGVRPSSPGAPAVASEAPAADPMPSPASAAPARASSIAAAAVGEKDDDVMSRCSTMSTASLIANGCTYTILEQMFMAYADEDVGESKGDAAVLPKRNVAFFLAKIAKSLEAIEQHLVGGGKPEASPPPKP